MAGAIASQIGLVLAVLVLGALVLSLARQIGVLHERTAPGGGLLQRAQRLRTLDLDAVRAATLAGQAAPLRQFVDKGGAALLFVSDACPVCRSLLPKFPALSATFGVRPLVAPDAAPQADLMRFAEEHGLAREMVLVSGQLAAAAQVLQTPTLVLLAGDGRILERVRLRGIGHLKSVLSRREAAMRTEPQVQEDGTPSTRR